MVHTKKNPLCIGFEAFLVGLFFHSPIEKAFVHRNQSLFDRNIMFFRGVVDEAPTDEAGDPAGEPTEGDDAEGEHLEFRRIDEAGSFQFENKQKTKRTNWPSKGFTDLQVIKLTAGLFLRWS